MAMSINTAPLLSGLSAFAVGAQYSIPGGYVSLPGNAFVQSAIILPGLASTRQPHNSADLFVDDPRVLLEKFSMAPGSADGGSSPPPGAPGGADGSDGGDGAGRKGRVRRNGYSGWGDTHENLKATLEYVVNTHLNGDIGRISTMHSFIQGSFVLPSGDTVTGERLINAVARLERPNRPVKETVGEFKQRGVIRIMKEKYLAELKWVQDWGGTEERLKETLEFVVEKYLDGDLDQISSGDGFLARSFVLASGKSVTGKRMMFAAAKLMQPDVNALVTVRRMGQSSVVKMVKEKYLADIIEAQDWGSTEEKLSETLRYVVDSYLGGNLDRLSSGPRFIDKSFELPSGKVVKGRMLISAVASMERPGMKSMDALQEIKASNIVAIIKEKYLADMYEAQDWGGTFDKLKATLRYILETHLGGELGRKLTGKRFVARSFELASGKVVSGRQLIYAVASLEWPDISARETLKKIRKSEILKIIRDKYLFTLDDTPASFVKAMRLIMGQDGSVEDKEKT